MNLQIKDNQYLPNGFGKPASTYYYIVDVDSTKKSKYLSKKTGKFITSTAFDIKYDGFYNEEQAESFLKNYLKTNAPTQESKYPTINLIKKMIKEEWVSFGSHRTHEKAERILGQLPKAKTSFRHKGQYYELDSEQISKIKNLK